jgi:hypothetical protein
MSMPDMTHKLTRCLMSPRTNLVACSASIFSKNSSLSSSKSVAVLTISPKSVAVLTISPPI